MPRKQYKRQAAILPDPRFGNQMIAKFINMVMLSGKKSVAEQIVYGAMDEITDKTKQDPVEVVERALDNVRPVVEVKSRRVGGSTYQIPVEVRPTRRTSLAMRWIIDASRKRSEKSMHQRLAGELLEAADKRGSAMKKRDDVHRMADANKAFAHYRW